MSSEDKPPKKRGAQPGNLNALKHGFYSKAFRASELKGVQEIEEYDVAQEIDLLRLIIKRTAESAGKVESFESQVRFLSVLTYATAQLSRLLNIQDTFERRKKYQEETIPIYQEYLADMRAMLTRQNPADPGQTPTREDPPDDDNDSETHKYTQVEFRLPESRGDSF